jgi:hypothetical protein
MSMHYLMEIVVKIRVRTIRIEVITTETNSLYSINIKTQLSHIIHTGWSCSFLTSAAVMGGPDGTDVQAGLTDWMIYQRRMGRADSCISCRWCLVQSARPSLLSNIFCGLLHMLIGRILIFSSRPLDNLTHGLLKKSGGCSSSFQRKLAFLNIWPWRWRYSIPPKCWWTSTSPHDIASQKIILFMIIAWEPHLKYTFCNTAFRIFERIVKTGLSTSIPGFKYQKLKVNMCSNTLSETVDCI